MLDGLKRMMGLATPISSAPRVKRGGGFSRWIGEISPGRWKSVWRGTSNYKGYCSGVAETRRRRQRILGLRSPAINPAEHFSDRLTMLAEARAAEYPLTSLERKAA